MVVISWFMAIIFLVIAFILYAHCTGIGARDATTSKKENVPIFLQKMENAPKESVVDLSDQQTLVKYRRHPQGHKKCTALL